MGSPGGWGGRWGYTSAWGQVGVRSVLCVGLNGRCLSQSGMESLKVHKAPFGTGIWVTELNGELNGQRCVKAGELPRFRQEAMYMHAGILGRSVFARCNIWGEL